jgi:hypothetical protein
MDDKKHRPDNSQFRQQRLPAWQPVMSPPHVTACLIFLAVIFIPIGIAVILANDSIKEYEFRYDDMRKCTSNNNEGILSIDMGGAWGTYTQGCRVTVNFTISADVAGPMYMYYKLTNFYQNHRRFAKSRDTQQIAGVDVGEPSSDCEPLLTPGSFWGNTSVSMTINNGAATMTYANYKYSPCGLVAWSQFNDTFILYKRNVAADTRTVLCDTSQFTTDTNEPFNASDSACVKSGITWSSDKDKFKKVHLADNIWTGNRSAYGASSLFNSTDPFIRHGYYAFEPGHKVPITLDEDFMVWMRTASLPTFRKLYRIFPNGLKAGDYSMEILEFFDSQQYEGTKSFVLSTVSWVGAKNSFLGYAYIVVGAICAVCAIIFYIVHRVTGDRTQDAIEVLAELR